MLTKKLSGLFLTMCVASIAMAQTGPALHERSGQAAAPAQAEASDFEKGFSTLPEGASGEYELDKDGSVVQITIEQNRLSGYVTKMEQGSALTLLFLRTSIQGDRISFSTRTVHGLSYSFTGEVLRGDKAQAASQAGLYRLAGRWTGYHDGGHETEWVNLKSTPRNSLSP